MNKDRTANQVNSQLTGLITFVENKMSKAKEIIKLVELAVKARIPKNKVKAEGFDDGKVVTLFAGTYVVLGIDSKDKSLTIIGDDTGDLFLINTKELQKYMK